MGEIVYTIKIEDKTLNFAEINFKDLSRTEIFKITAAISHINTKLDLNNTNFTGKVEFIIDFTELNSVNIKVSANKLDSKVIKDKLSA
jgi:hypothetical protein